LVGWTVVSVSQTRGLISHISGAGATDAGTGAALPVNTAYFTSLLPSQTKPGMFYTTSSAGTARVAIPLSPPLIPRNIRT